MSGARCCKRSTLHSIDGGNLDQYPATGSLGTSHSNSLTLCIFLCKLRTVPPSTCLPHMTVQVTTLQRYPEEEADTETEEGWTPLRSWLWGLRKGAQTKNKKEMCASQQHPQPVYSTFSAQFSLSSLWESL